MIYKSVLIIGATSSIARAIAENFAQTGTALYLLARDEVELERVAKDLAIRHTVSVSWSAVEVTAYHTHLILLQKAEAFLGKIDGVVVCIGELGNQSQAQVDFNAALPIINSNYTGVVSLLTHTANYLEQQKSGFIIGISSVAGDRGRQSNYVYGSAKGGLNLFLQGLRQRLDKSNIHVMTVKPGFVDTKMTFGMSGLFLVAHPSQVATDILQGLKQRKNQIYTPWFWFFILQIIKIIPESFFKKISL